MSYIIAWSLSAGPYPDPKGESIITIMAIFNERLPPTPPLSKKKKKREKKRKALSVHTFVNTTDSPKNVHSVILHPASHEPNHYHCRYRYR